MTSATMELLDRLAQSFLDDSKASDYRLAKSYFHVSPQKVSGWRTGKMSFSDERVVSVCETLWPGDDAKKVHWLARVHADREQNAQLKALWHQIAERSAAAVLALVVGFGALLPAPPASSSAPADVDSKYYVKSRRRRAALRSLSRLGRRLAATVQRMKARWFITWLPIMALAGCQSTWQTEGVWLGVHSLDVLQTLNGPARDPCYVEGDPITSALIGEQPSEGEVIAWGIALAGLHAGVTWALEHADAPRWVQTGWQVLTIGNSAVFVARGYRMGVRPWGDNDHHGHTCAPRT